jgi:gliding motility-associated-like protein
VFVLNFDITLNETQIKTVKGLSFIELIEEVPDYALFYSPNDHNSSTMWNLEKIKARQAWDLEKGGKNILIALVDDGMDTAHSDLQPTLWKNINETPNNGIDDDNNGYIDDFFGWDMADNDNDPHVTASNNLSHGTHCAGTIGAKTDNNNGISGIGFNIKIMPIKCGRNGSSGIFNAYQGVEYAIENGARIISMSWGGGSYSYIYQLIFDVAAQREVVCVAAAGNSSTNTQMYPAAYNNVISVGSTTSSDAKSSFSNYGTWIDVMAPGSSIYSSTPGNTYGYKSGTSMACPLVSGLCGLMLSRNPKLTAAQVETCLKNTCDNIDTMNQSLIGSIGAGRINAYKALLCIKTVNAQFTTSKQFLCTGDTVRYIDKSIQTPNSWYWEFQGGTPSVSTNQNPFVRYNTNGTYKVKLRVIRGNDTDIIEKLNYITIGKPDVRFSGVQTINKGEYATIKADFTGVAPWTLVYQDRTKKDTIYNILQTPYFILKTPDSSIVYKPISVSSFGCFGTVKDSTKITVSNQINNSNCDSSLRFHATFGGSGDDIGYDIEIESDTNIFIVGSIYNQSNNSFDGFLSRLNKSGDIIWNVNIGNRYTDLIYSVKVDSKLNSYITASVYPDNNSSDKMMYIAKFNANGNLSWEKFFSGSSVEYMRNIVISKFDNRYLYFMGPVVSNSFGGEDVMIVKIDTSGTIIWTRNFGTSGYTERPESITEDNSGNIYIAGYQAVLGRFLMKINSSGNLIFSNGYLASSEKAYLFSVYHYKNHIYTSGYSETTSGTINRELCITKHRLNGVLLWAKKYPATSTSTFVSQTKTIVDNDKIITSWSVSKGNADGYIMTLDTNGNVLLYNSIGTNTEDVINGIATSKDNSIYYVGYENQTNKQVVIGKLNCKLKNKCKNILNTVSVTNLSPNTNNGNFSSGNISINTSSSISKNKTSVNTNFTCKSNLTIVKKSCKLSGNFNFLSTCLGDTTYFSGQAIDSNQFDINGWYWDFGDNSSISGKQSPLKLYQQAGIYIVKLIVTSSLGNQICADTIQKTIEINNSLKIQLMPTDATICLGDSIQPLSPYAICGAKPYQYEWLPNLNLNNNKIAQPYFSPKETTTYLLTITDQNGMKAYDSLTITVDKSCCKSLARFECMQENICIGDSVTFINTSNYDANSAYFLWKFTGANINSYIGIKPPAVIFSNTGNAKVELFLSDICSNDTLESNFFIFPKPISNAGPDYTICGLDTMQLGEESFGRTIYQWTPTTGLSNPFLSDPILKTNVAQNYILSIVDEYGCTNKDTMQVFFKADTILIQPRDTAVCPGNPFTLNVNIQGPYLWNTGATSSSITTQNSGMFKVSIQGKCLLKDSVTISHLPLPSFSLGKDTGFCINETINLKTNVSGFYLWNTGDNSQSIFVNKSGAYWLKVTDQATGCFSSDTIKIDEYQLPQFKIIGDSLLCKNNGTLKVDRTFNDVKYFWNNNSTSNIININNSGKYSLIITDSNQCEYIDEIDVIKGQQPIIFGIKDTTKCINTNFNYQLTSIPGQTYRWYNQSTGPTLLVTLPGKYFVEAKTECGDTTAYFEVFDDRCQCDVWIPNGFSPNKNNINDYFAIKSNCQLIEFDFRVFNRWGEIIYLTNEPNFEWDGIFKGDIVPNGVYYYLIKYRKNVQNIQLFEELSGFIEVVK